MEVTQELVEQTLSRFAVLFPVPEHSKTPELALIWYGLFNDMEVEVFCAACRDCAMELKTFPLPADVQRFAGPYQVAKMIRKKRSQANTENQVAAGATE
ncbi:hypothetical protein [Chromobacterium violaceum]|uniref:hypothetical protein n=1 Tax=Chromobacterium violaceum TaxID=536 RepID=UPI0012D36A70|nr:hypothetical protein [Chromobacterium violaceum]